MWLVVENSRGDAVIENKDDKPTGRVLFRGDSYAEAQRFCAELSYKLWGNQLKSSL